MTKTLKFGFVSPNNILPGALWLVNIHLDKLLLGFFFMFLFYIMSAHHELSSVGILAYYATIAY